MIRRALCLAVGMMLLAGCGAKSGPQSMEDRELVHSRVVAALADFKRADPSLAALLNTSQAYAIFPQVVSVAVGVGGAHGDGEVYQNGALIGSADVSQGSVGAQLGGQKYAELVLFQNEGALSNFTHGTLEFDARATAVAASNGAGKTADYSRGVMVFTLPESGLMAQASLGLQKFRFRAVGQ